MAFVWKDEYLSKPYIDDRRTGDVAKKTIRVSDLSGTEITENHGAVVTIKFNDGRRGTFVLDIDDAEAAVWIEKAAKVPTRGRPRAAVT